MIRDQQGRPIPPILTRNGRRASRDYWLRTLSPHDWAEMGFREWVVVDDQSENGHYPPVESIQDGIPVWLILPIQPESPES